MKKWYKYLSKIQAIFALLTLTCIPVVYSPTLASSYELPKIGLFIILSSCMFAILLLRYFLKLHDEGKIDFHWISGSKLDSVKIILLILLFFNILVSSYFATNTITNLWGNYDKRFGLYLLFHLGLFYLVCADSIKNEYKFLSEYLPVFINVPIILNFLVILQQIFEINFDLKISEGRVVGLFGQANFLASMFLAFTPLLMYYFFKSKLKIEKVYYLTVLLISIISIYLTGSRFAKIAELAIIAVTIIPFLSIEKIYSDTRPKLFVMFIIFLSILSFIVIVNDKRFKELGFIDSTRILVWQSSVSMIEKNPWVGYGFDNAGSLLPSEMYNLGVDHAIGLDRAHSEPLDIALIGGIGMLISLSLLIIISFYKFAKHLKYSDIETDSDRRLFSIVIVISLIVILFRSIIDVNGIWQYIFMIFSFSLISNETKINSDILKSFKIKYNNFFLIGVFVLFILLFINFGKVLSIYKANEFYKLYQRTNEEFYIAKSVELEPNQIQYRIEWADKLLSSRESFDIDEIIPDKFIRQKSNPVNLYFTLGRYYEQQGDVEQAKMMYTRAYEIEPVRESYKYNFERINKE